MKNHWIAIAYTSLAIVIAWTAWVWVRWPAPKVPSDKQVIAALTAQFEKEKQAEYNKGYEWCGAEPRPEVFMKGVEQYWNEQGKKLDPLNNGDFSGRPVAQ